MRKLFATGIAAVMLTAGAGTALANHGSGPGPNGKNDYGLCTAWAANENGRENGNAGNAPPFDALRRHAENETGETGDAAIEEFCSTAFPGGKDSHPGKGRN